MDEKTQRDVYLSRAKKKKTNNLPHVALYRVDRNTPYMYMPILDVRGGTSYHGLYMEAPPERGSVFRLQVYEICRFGR